MEGPKGVSQERIHAVKNIAASDTTGKSKKKIDTQAEFDKLSEYLANNTQDMNNAERAFIQEQLDEFTNLLKEQKKKEEESKITDNARKLVENYAKGSGPDKKKIDSRSEAMDLLSELDNPNNDFNAADRAYILKIVNESGFLPRQGFGLTTSDSPSTSANSNEASAKKSESLEENIPPVDEKPVDKKPVKKKPVKKYENDDQKPVNEKPVDKKPAEGTKKSTEGKMTLNPEQAKVAKDIRVSIDNILEISKKHGKYSNKMGNAIRTARAVLNNAKALQMEKTVIYQELDRLVKTYSTV